MNVELINTGNELLLGTTLNTHLAYLGARLFSLGLRLSRQVTVPDSFSIRTALEEAIPRSDIVFITGGLGPTSDDLTRNIVAELLNCPLQPNAQVHRQIEKRLTSLGRPFPESSLCQTLVPKGAEIFLNEYGTAPGLYFPAGLNPHRPHICLLPGPPEELKPMFERSCVPLLSRLYKNTHQIEQRIFHIVGLGETAVEEKIGHTLSQTQCLEVGYCSRLNELDFRLIGPRGTLEEMTPQIYDALGTHIISSKGESLEQIIVERLRERKETLAVAESCTGGLIAHRITNIPGASEIFLEGFVVYSNQAKSERLEVPPSTIELYGSVSEPVAREMAERALQLTGATYALSVTGFAGPSGGSASQPIGTVFIGSASQRHPTEVCKKNFLAEREPFKQLTAQTALNMLRLLLISP